MNKVYRLYTEKKTGFDVAVHSLKKDLSKLLGINADDAREFLRYDVQNITEADFNAALGTVFSEPQSDNLYPDGLPDLKGYKAFAMEFLAGQYDQRADSCMQCVQALTGKERPLVRCARVLAFKGITDAELNAVKRYLINPVESREADMKLPKSLELKAAAPEPTPTIAGFIKMNANELQKYYDAAGYAMTIEDLKFVQDYFKGEKRDPSLTELKVLDTYWSDHCRHTTFNTELTDVKIEGDNPHIKAAYKTYTDLRKELFVNRPDKYPSLMDLATITMRKFKKDGKLNNLEESEEINACSVKVKAKINGKPQDWLVMFKNETHNHPTEIEPFGCAATCLGGGIRDPLSGRAYVYQGMRFTGAADPTVPLSQTMKGKLPQRVLTKTAANGFSNYGGQIGLATGVVKEFYHPGFAAKRMEGGFTIAAAPEKNVVRGIPVPGDVVMLIGGGTGRDGCGGATGSSKSQSVDSAEVCGAEVQKGNAYIERNIQRLFRAEKSAKLIKRCNDFGAGGVSVCIGELADGLEIDLNAVPLKYAGLTATEIAISESQERMAVVIAKKDAAKFTELCNAQNLKATVVAVVTDTNRVIMKYDGKAVLDLSRKMLNSSGVRQRVAAHINENGAGYFDALDPETEKAVKAGDINAALKINLAKLNVCSQKGLTEMFDSGAGAVFTTLGGKYQITPNLSMAAKLPADGAETATVCAWGYDPDLMSENTFIGAVYALMTSIIKVVVSGVDISTMYLTLQEYFKRLNMDPARWGQPAAALLGAMYTQINMGIAAIGGKDSMSGTFENINVPPSIVAFAMGTADASALIPNVFAGAGQKVYLLPLKRDKYMMPDFEYAKKLLKAVYGQTQKGKIKAVTVTETGGAACAVMKSCFGNGLGFKFNTPSCGCCSQGFIAELFKNRIGDIIIAADGIGELAEFAPQFLGETTAEADKELLDAFTGTLETVFPTKPCKCFGGEKTEFITSDKKSNAKPLVKCAKPRVFMPLFLGMNAEYETAESFKAAGAVPEIYVVKNQSGADVEDAAKDIAKQIKESQILMLTGGFSDGGEPVGSGRFTAAILRNPRVADAIKEFLTVKKGLILGVSSGFKALLNTGLLPYGEIRQVKAGGPALSANTINRYMARVSEIRVASALSPWMSGCKAGDRFLVPIAHGEGRFTASEADIKLLIKNGQIAAQYSDENPNGSVCAVESITDASGLILGKMGHSERAGKGLFRNVSGNYDMKIFESGVKYYN